MREGISHIMVETAVIVAKKYIVQKTLKHWDMALVFCLCILMFTMDVAPMLARGIDRVNNQPLLARVLEPEVGLNNLGCPVGRKVGVNAVYGYSAGYFGGAVWHNGIDLNIVNEELYSLFGGVVKSKSWDYLGGGNLLVVEGVDGRRFWYAHMSVIDVEVGEMLKVGDYVGMSGNTGGLSTGAHLHLSVLVNGVHVDPFETVKDCIL